MNGDCVHIWIYDHKNYTTIFMRCSRCGAVRTCDPGNELLHPYANIAAKELRIRHDGEEGDM